MPAKAPTAVAPIAIRPDGISQSFLQLQIMYAVITNTARITKPNAIIVSL